ncbi:MAG TPA: hypothetical protein VGF04_00815 [Solirubrobacterales bacterium]|jgi:hypothetical protein
MHEPSDGYSIDELHAYAKAHAYSDEAMALQRYVKLQRKMRQLRKLGLRRAPRNDNRGIRIVGGGAQAAESLDQR